jgi:intracellular sulfur oxidation DsrE/DsrF family protein
MSIRVWHQLFWLLFIFLSTNIPVVKAATQSNQVDHPVVVYHVNQGMEQAELALRFIQNHLEEAPNTRIHVVTHSSGVYFLLNNAQTSKGQALSPVIEKLQQQGVIFKVCERTVHSLGLKESQFQSGVVFVASGVVEISRLQQQGASYIKP